MSPIKGLSERRRLPRLGKIHLGIRNEKGWPEKVDYFVCPPEVQAIFGEKPRELRILIPVEDEERWCSQYYRCYSRSRGLVCKGDGVECLRLVDTETGDLAWKDDAKKVDMRVMACAGRECPDYKEKCREIMNLQFLLPEVPGLGIWQVDTGSINSILNINSAADLIKRLYGRISLIPLLLTLEPRDAKTPEGHKQKVFVLNLRTKTTLDEMMQLIRKPLDLILSLPPGEEDIEAVDLPVSDDETPELIIPANQAPLEKEPEAKAEPKSAPFTSYSPGSTTTGIAARPIEEVKPPATQLHAPAATGEIKVPFTPKRDPNIVQSIKELWRALWEDCDHLQPNEALVILNIKTWNDLTITPSEAYIWVVTKRALRVADKESK